jgi:mRNA interferase MazF
MVRKKHYTPRKGDVVWLDFSPQAGREQRGRRPALVVSATSYNHTGLMLACPITSKIKGYPFEVPIAAPPIHGAVLADHVKNQDWKVRDAAFITQAPEQVLKSVQQIIAALLVQ